MYICVFLFSLFDWFERNRMGKADKGKKGKGDVVAKSGPLESQMFQSDFAKPSGRQKQRRTEEVEDRRRFVGSGMTAKILQQARLQNEEMLDEMTPDAPTASHTADKKGDKILSWTASKREKKLDSDEEELSDDAADDQFDGGRECEEIEINEEDEEAFNRFLSGDSKTKRTLADVIFDKITEKQTEVASQMSEVGPEVRELDPRLVEMYQGVRDVLSTYRSGKLPKAFKIIPKLSNWEQILYITEPEKWSAAAMYQATRIFASNLNAKMCQRFFNLVLLPRIRDDIAEYRRLNPHLYMALKKALFKPAAFFKGILLPLCESCTCTLREATLIGSVLTKCTIPVLHSAAAMLKIAEMEYSGANSIFLRILLDKKYALPYRVTDALVFHFLRFMGDQRVMTVLWHQSLLVFAQRYKQDLSEEQRESLLELLKKQSHEKITPEIRRELLHAVSRDQTEAVEKQQVRVVTDNPDMQIC